MIKTIKSSDNTKDLLEMTESVYQVILKHNPPKNLKVVVAILPNKLSNINNQRAVMMIMENDLEINSWRRMEDFSNSDLTIRPTDSHDEKLRKFFTRKTPHSLLCEGDIVILVDNRMAHDVRNKDFSAAMAAAAYCQNKQVPLIGGNLLLTIESVAIKKAVMNPKTASKYVKKVAKIFFKDDLKNTAVSFGD